MRLILAFIFVSLVFEEYWLLNEGPVYFYPLGYFGQFLFCVTGAFFAILMASALIVFFSSFFEIYKNEEDELCYDPSNFFWKTMKWLYPETWNDEFNTLCKSFWLTVFPISVVSLAGTLLTIAFLGCLSAINKSGFLLFIKTIGLGTLTTLAVIGIVALLTALVALVIKKFPKIEPFLKWTATGIVVLVLLFIFVCLPPLSIREEAVKSGMSMSLFEASAIYAQKFLRFSTLTATFGLVAFGLFLWIRYLIKSTVLGYYLAQLKELSCPKLKGCPLPKK